MRQNPVVPALRDFAALYPAVELAVGIGDHAVDLIAEGIDCAVRIGKLHDSSLVAKQIGMLKMLTCASPEYLALHGTPRDLDDLAQHRAVNYFVGRERKILEWQFIRGAKTVPIKLRSGLLVNDSDALLAGALAGFGLLQALELTVAEQLHSGMLISVLQDYPPVSKSVWLLYPHRQHLPPQVRAFIEWISMQFGASAH